MFISFSLILLAIIYCLLFKVFKVINRFLVDCLAYFTHGLWQSTRNLFRSFYAFCAHCFFSFLPLLHSLQVLFIFFVTLYCLLLSYVQLLPSILALSSRNLIILSFAIVTFSLIVVLTISRSSYFDFFRMRPLQISPRFPFFFNLLYYLLAPFFFIFIVNLLLLSLSILFIILFFYPCLSTAAIYTLLNLQPPLSVVPTIFLPTTLFHVLLFAHLSTIFLMVLSH